MRYTSVQPSAYAPMLKFTVDGRPSVEDIHDLFSTMVYQVTFSTHRHMFSNYEHSFTSEEAITQLGMLQCRESSGTQEVTTLNIKRDMSKALIQQFLWSRLIENAVESHNRSYKDKGIWKLKPKSLCVLQAFCTKLNLDFTWFKTHIGSSCTDMIFLIQIERMPGSDYFNPKVEYMSLLFAFMIASLRVGNKNTNKKETTANNTFHKQTAKRSSLFMFSEFTNSESSKPSSLYSIDSSSTYTPTTNGHRALTFADYFPHVNILPNDKLTHKGYIGSAQQSTLAFFKQQSVLLHNLNPSHTNTFKMRTMFTSYLCCNWLVGYCTVASNDEAESIMTEFLNLGWITFHEHKQNDKYNVESSESTILRLTNAGMKVVKDVSLEQYNEYQRVESGNLIDSDVNSQKRYSVSSCFSSNQSVYTNSSAREERRKYSNSSYYCPLPSLVSPTETNSSYTGSVYSEINTPSLQSQITSTGLINEENYFSEKGTIKIDQQSPFIDMSSNSVFPTDCTAPSLLALSAPDTTTSSSNNNTNKLKLILNDSYLRSLFHDFMSINFCAENLDFWIDYDKLRKDCQAAMIFSSNEEDLLKNAYAVWETYLRPGARRELNIDHTLRNEMSKEIMSLKKSVRQPKTIETESSPYQSLTTVLNWLDKVNDQIFKLMTSDSVSKFIRTNEYKSTEEYRSTDTYKNTLVKEQHTAVYEVMSASRDLDFFPSPPKRALKKHLSI